MPNTDRQAPSAPDASSGTRTHPKVYPGRKPAQRSAAASAQKEDSAIPEIQPHSSVAISEVESVVKSEVEDAVGPEFTHEGAGEERASGMDEVVAEENTPQDETDRAYLDMHQRQRRQLLDCCAALTRFDFQALAMAEWPENYTLALARRLRDRWLFCMSLLAVLFLSGVAGLAPPWLAGIAFGLFALGTTVAHPAIRQLVLHQLVLHQPSYGDLLVSRRQLLRGARKHIAFIEGRMGLAWQCQPLTEYNPALRHARFLKLVNLSRTGNLADYIRTRTHVRLYLMFLLEAEKAYDLMHTAYLEARDRAGVEGEDVVSHTLTGSSSTP